jgi:hypothetical protein
MKIWYPPWASDWDESEIPSWTVQQRHLWMSKALGLRRRIQAANYGRDELEHYKTLLSQFFDPCNFEADHTTIIEILSDGLGDVEPYWHGLKVQSDGVSEIVEWEHQNFIQKVRERRAAVVNALVYKTHLEIGKKLLEPSLFKITESEVEYYSQSRWCELDTADCPLPLKLAVDHKNRINWEDIQTIRRTLPEVFKDESYKQTINDIKNSLLSLSKDVLWPGLFSDKYQKGTDKLKKGESVSLVLIQASTWQVPGVWALHAYSECERVSKEDFKQAELQSTINPPVQCLNDALGAMFQRDSSHEHRQNDVRLYRKCKGIDDSLTPENEFYGISMDEIAIYEHSLSSDPLERYGHIYQSVCKYYAEEEESQRPSDLRDGSLLMLERAVEQAFVSVAVQHREPYSALFILRDTVDLCVKLMSEASVDPEHRNDCLCSKFARSQLVSNAHQWLVDFSRTPPSAQISNLPQQSRRIIKLIGSAFMCVASRYQNTTNDEVESWFRWCGNGLRALVLGSDSDSQLTRDAYNDWENSGGSVEAGQQPCSDILRKVGLQGEAVWFILNLIEEQP